MRDPKGIVEVEVRIEPRAGTRTYGLVPANTEIVDGVMYVQGEDGKRYSLVVRNLTGGRIETVISVDGLDSISGDDASHKLRGYCIGPHQVCEVTGFRLSSEEVAAFRFGAQEASYAEGKGKPRNIGVIGVAVWEEKETPKPKMTVTVHDKVNLRAARDLESREYDVGSLDIGTKGRSRSAASGSKISKSSGTSYSAEGISVNYSQASFTGGGPEMERGGVECSTGAGQDQMFMMSADPGPSYRSRTTMDSMDSDSLRSMNFAPASASLPDASPDAGISLPEKSRDELVAKKSNNLGTVFGERRKDHTYQTRFERRTEFPATEITIRYEAEDFFKENFEKRDQADPFPANSGYAKPPVGWNG